MRMRRLIYIVFNLYCQSTKLFQLIKVMYWQLGRYYHQTMLKYVFRGLGLKSSPQNYRSFLLVLSI